MKKNEEYKDYPLQNVLKKIFGFESFKGNQEPIIRNLLAGNDTFVIMPTGGGKSMCYQLPAMISVSYTHLDVYKRQDQPYS